MKIGVPLRSSGKAWMARHVSDPYVKKSLALDLRSRSAFKIKEIQEKFKIIRPSDFVIDLGAAPGGWSVMISSYVDFTNRGKLVAVDLLPMKPIVNCTVVQGDMTSLSCHQEITRVAAGREADVVVSDMLQNASGNHARDHFRSVELCTAALEFCSINLRKGGTFFCKYLRGEDEKEFLAHVQSLYRDVRAVKPKSSRSESAEMFMLARDKV